MAICIIPARGGSKRLPRKNILPFRGVPLLGHVVRNVSASGVFDEIVVSSDDDEILGIASDSGANIHRRQQAIANDRSTVVDVCLDVLSKKSSEIFCCIYPTAVLLRAETIARASHIFSRFNESKVSVLMGVSKFNYHPLQALQIDPNGCAKLMFPGGKDLQSQFYPDVRVSNGTFYWGRKAAFQLEKTFYSEKLKLFDVPEEEVSDLNTEEDYQILLRLR